MSFVSSPNNPALLVQAGIWVPPTWGSIWRPKRVAAQSGIGKATIAVVGDSIAQGFYSSNLDTKSWPGVLKAALQARYGDGGSGFKSSADSNAGLTALGVAAGPITNWGSSVPATTGAWQGNPNLGPGSFSLNQNSTGGAGSTQTYVVRGTTVSVIYLTNTGLGSFSWTVDGAGQGTVNTAGAQGAAKVSAAGLTPGTHTVVITTPAATPAVYIAGVSGENATGVVLNKFGRASAQSAHFNQTDVFGAGWSGGPSYPADLIIYCLGVNDTGIGNVAPDTWAQNVSRYLVNAKSAASGAQDIIIVLPHVGQADGNYQYLGYAARAWGIANAYGAALVDFWTLGQNSWDNWHGLNYWSVEDGTGNPGASANHPSDTGHAYMASTIQTILTA